MPTEEFLTVNETAQRLKDQSRDRAGLDSRGEVTGREPSVPDAQATGSPRAKCSASSRALPRHERLTRASRSDRRCNDGGRECPSLHLEANGGGGWTIRIRLRPQGWVPNGERPDPPTVNDLGTLADQLRAAGMTVERMAVRNGSYLWVRDER